MRSPLAALLVLAAGLPLAACSAFSGAAQPVFDQGMLNATWYGTYHRPLDLDTPSLRPTEHNQDVARRSEAPQRASAAQAARREPAPPAPSVEDRPTRDAGAGPAPVDPTGVYHPHHAASYVRAVYALNETDAGPGDGSIVDLYRHAQEHGRIYHETRPAGGDLVFFHNTWDRNGDGRSNDWFTHVGVVESVDEHGTVSVLSYIGGRVGRLWLNLEDPERVQRDNDPVNTELRRRADDDHELTQYTAGRLFAGFASLLDDRAEVLVLDRWSPGDGRVASTR